MATEKRVAVIRGDGVGTEVVEQGLRALSVIAERRGHAIELVELDLGAERFLRDGATFPEADAQQIREHCDAVLLGALGDPRIPDLRYARDILFGLRFGLDLYCNIRPVECLSDRLMPLKGRRAEDCKFTVFRENSEGIYVGVGGSFKKGTVDEVAINEDLNTRKGVERILVAAFDFAQGHGLRLHMADKHNAMEHAHGLWYRTFRDVAERYPDVECGHLYVDALCHDLIRDPRRFQVIVTCNLFGDIITDLGAALQGGLGMAASANVRPGGMGVFEPVHGSAPDLAGTDRANPIATLLSVAMMLQHLGWSEEAQLLRRVVVEAVEGAHCTADVGGTLGTRACGDWIVGALEQRLD